jgi:hypothetical protein
MAKLSAHGHEVARLTYGGPRPDSDALVSHETFTLSFRSDGHILRKQQVTFRSPNCDGSEHRHDYGWKLYKRYSDRKITPQRILAAAERMHERVVQRAKAASLSTEVSFKRGVIL